jgi:hypothetical protein
MRWLGAAPRSWPPALGDKGGGVSGVGGIGGSRGVTTEPNGGARRGRTRGGGGPWWLSGWPLTWSPGHFLQSLGTASGNQSSTSSPVPTGLPLMFSGGSCCTMNGFR